MAVSTVVSEREMHKIVRNMLMTQEERNEAISLHLCKILDFLGYSEKMSQFRKSAYKEWDIMCTADGDVTFITSGSKGEGLARPFESDTDQLFVIKGIVCREENNVVNIPRSLTVLTFNSYYEHPGYSLLRMHRYGASIDNSILAALIPKNRGQPVVSSDAYIEYIADTPPSIGVVRHARGGPALQDSIGKAEYDRVMTFRSVSSTALDRWLKRPRQYDWPPCDLRLEISKMEGNFVAKGCKQSDMCKHEWRQCFNEIELLLVHSLEETHRKLYILLKRVLKDIIRPFDFDKVITSYTMKNIVFWLAEMNPRDAFRPKHLIKWLIKALVMLRQSIIDVTLPYYMIPERNLLADNITDQLQEKLRKCLNRLIRQGPRLLFSCRKLTITRKMSYIDLLEYKEKRDDLEMLYLSTNNYIESKMRQEKTDDDLLHDQIVRSMFGQIKQLASLNWPTVIEEKLMFCRNVEERIDVLLE